MLYPQSYPQDLWKYLTSIFCQSSTFCTVIKLIDNTYRIDLGYATKTRIQSDYRRGQLTSTGYTY
jgi:hypothetical protein